MYFHPKFVRGEKKLCQQITPGASKTERSQHSEPINPAVAWNIATPAMLHHGLIDRGMPMVDLHSDPFQPTPIDPRLDLQSLAAASPSRDNQLHQLHTIAANNGTIAAMSTSSHMLQQQIQFLQHGAMQNGLEGWSAQDIGQLQQGSPGTMFPQTTPVRYPENITSVASVVAQTEATHHGRSNFIPSGSTPAQAHALSTTSSTFHNAEPVSSTTSSSFSDVLDSFARGKESHQTSINDDLLDTYLKEFRDEHQKLGKDS